MPNSPYYGPGGNPNDPSTANTGPSGGFNWGWVGNAAAGGFNFLTSCKGNCWTSHPPLSGRAADRQICLENCQRASVPQPPPNQMAGGGILLPALLIGGLAYMLLK